MYYFLGIVAQDDIVKGNFSPSYILYKSKGTSVNRSSWRVMRQNLDNKIGMSKVLTTSLTGNDIMIDFLCSYRTRDHMHGDKNYSHEETKKYYPKGALCWFECDVYGNPTGKAIYIKKVPVDKLISKSDQGFTMLKENLAYIPPIKTVLAREPTHINNEWSDVKFKIKEND